MYKISEKQRENILKLYDKNKENHNKIKKTRVNLNIFSFFIQIIKINYR